MAKESEMHYGDERFFATATQKGVSRNLVNYCVSGLGAFFCEASCYSDWLFSDRRCSKRSFDGSLRNIVNTQYLLATLLRQLSSVSSAGAGAAALWAFSFSVRRCFNELSWSHRALGISIFVPASTEEDLKQDLTEKC